MTEYTIEKKIGSGGYGNVYLANKNKQILVVKKYQKMSNDIFYQIIREINIVRSLNHPNIIRFIKLIKYPNVEIILEYGGINLKLYYESIDYKKRLEQIKSISYQIISGCLYLHKLNILHRDIKPQNILIKDGIIKICDFGLAKKNTLNVNVNSCEACTLYYKPIELLVGSKTYTNSIDVWCIGCVLYEFVIAKVLFKGSTEINMLKSIFSSISTKQEDLDLLNLKEWKLSSCNTDSYNKLPALYELEINTQDADLLNSLKNLIDQMLVLNPEKRISLENAIKHPFFDHHSEKTNLDKLIDLNNIINNQNFYVRTKLPKNITTETRKKYCEMIQSYNSKISKDTILSSINIFDRYLTIKDKQKRNLDIIVICAMTLASKYIDIRAMTFTNGNFSFNNEELIKNEFELAQLIDYDLSQPTLLDLYRFLFPNKKIDNLVWENIWEIILDYELLKNKGIPELRELISEKFR